MAIGDYLPRRTEGEMSDYGLMPVAREFERMFNRFVSDFMPTRRGMEMGMMFAPRVNMTEDDKEIRVTAELPGVSEKDVDLEVTPDGLIIRGEKREERKEEEKGARRYSEVTYGAFERLIPLDEDIDPNKVEATYDRGMLNIRLPKMPESSQRRRKIQIKSQQGQSQRQQQH